MKHQCIEHGEVGFCDGCLVDSLHHEINQLKTQLAVYKEDMQKDAEKIADLEKYQRVNGECINNLVNQKHDYLHRVTMAIAHLDSFDLSRAGINKLQRSIESALEALRGTND